MNTNQFNIKDYKKKLDLYIDQDDYAMLNHYALCNNETVEKTINMVFGYTMKIIRNRLKFHLTSNDINYVIQWITKENNIDLNKIMQFTSIYNQLIKKCKSLCNKRYDYAPFEKTYWYDVLVELLKTQEKIKNVEDIKTIN